MEIEKVEKEIKHRLWVVQRVLDFNTKNTVREEQLVNDYTKAIERDPKNAKAYHNRGWSYDQLGKGLALDSLTREIFSPDWHDIKFPGNNIKEVVQIIKKHINSLKMMLKEPVQNPDEIKRAHYKAEQRERKFKSWKAQEVVLIFGVIMIFSFFLYASINFVS